MASAVILQVIEDGTYLEVVPGGGRVGLGVRQETEVDVRVGAGLHRESEGLVAVDLGGYPGDVLLVRGLEGVHAAGIRVDGSHRSVEKDHGVRNAFSGEGIRHFSPDPGRLGGEPDRGQEEQEKRYDPVFRHNPPNIRNIWQTIKRTSCTGGPATIIWPVRAGCGRGIRRPRSRCGG